MFFGAIPKPAAQQIVSIVPFKEWRGVYLCMSGSFRLEQAIRASCPAQAIFANDISLYSTAIGKAAMGKTMRLTFTDRLAFVEDLLAGAPFIDRAAAVAVAHQMSRFGAQNDYCRKHFAYYETNFAQLVDKAREKVQAAIEAMKIQGFLCADYKVQVDAALAAGSGICTFPPFAKGAYEGHFRFLRKCVEWDEPEYSLYSPDELDPLIKRLEDAGAPYCICTPLLYDHRRPVMEFQAGRATPIYLYASTGKSSLRHLFSKSVPFKYKAIDPTAITEKSECIVVRAESKHLNYIKDVYLAKYIIHTSGLMGFFVLVDGMLVGGIIYGLQKYGIGEYKASECVYLLSDVTLSGERKLSKLVCLLATSRTLIGLVEKKLLQRVKLIVTTVWTNKPVSMKYRSIYRILKKEERKVDPGRKADVLHDLKPMMIQYGSDVREKTPQEIYKEWFQKYGRNYTPGTGNNGLSD